MKKRILIICTILFVSLNVYLIAKDNEHVQRVSYIPKWTEVEEKDMYETLDTTGVIDYAEQEFVYYDNDIMFDRFLVDKGDYVFIGDDLYIYEVTNFEAVKARLENKVDQLESEVDSIEDAISQMSRTSIGRSRTEVLIPDSDESIRIERDEANLTLQKEQYIIEKEKELDQVEAKLESVASQLDDLIRTGSTIYVSSPYEGVVTDISTALANPLITIQSEELHITGELTESERMDVKTHMPAHIQLIEELRVDDEDEDWDGTFDGFVNFVSNDPKNLSLNQSSIYPFHIAFDDEDDLDDLLRGYHVDLEITLDESLDATVIKEDFLYGSFVWEMGHDSLLMKKRVETGIAMDNYIEIIDGPYVGDRVAMDSRNNLIDGATFITPLKPSKSDWETMFKDGSRKRSIVIGLFAR